MSIPSPNSYRGRNSKIRLVVIHGGGPQLSDLAKRLGVESPKIAGRRITDDDTLELATMRANAAFALFESQLTPEGAAYTEIERYSLG